MNMKNKGQNISPISAIFFEEYMSLGYTFVSNHIVHKNLNGVCFFNKICYLQKCTFGHITVYLHTELKLTTNGGDIVKLNSFDINIL